MFRYNPAEVQDLLISFYNNTLSKNNDDHISGVKAMCCEPNLTGRTLKSFIHQAECWQIINELKAMPSRRSGITINGWHEYVLFIWSRQGWEKDHDMPKVRNKDIERAVIIFMDRLYKKIGDRFKYG